MSDDVKFIITTAVGLFTGGIIQAWFGRRKSNSDAYSTLLDALQKSGQTIEDLFTQLAEVPQLRSELKIAQSDLSILKKQFVIMISFARVHWLGSQKLYEQVVKLDEKPAFVPDDKFPTGPIENKAAV